MKHPVADVTVDPEPLSVRRRFIEDEDDAPTTAPAMGVMEEME